MLNDKQFIEINEKFNKNKKRDIDKNFLIEKNDYLNHTLKELKKEKIFTLLISFILIGVGWLYFYSIEVLNPSLVQSKNIFTFFFIFLCLYYLIVFRQISNKYENIILTSIPISFIILFSCLYFQFKFFFLGFLLFHLFSFFIFAFINNNNSSKNHREKFNSIKRKYLFSSQDTNFSNHDLLKEEIINNIDSYSKFQDFYYLVEEKELNNLKSLIPNIKSNLMNIYKVDNFEEIRNINKNKNTIKNM